MARSATPRDYAPPLPVRAGVYTAGTFPGVPRVVYRAAIKLHKAEDPRFMRLTFPRGADIRGPQMRGEPDIIEFPVGSRCTYRVVQSDDVGYPYANRRRFAIVTYWGEWPLLGRPEPAERPLND